MSNKVRFLLIVLKQNGNLVSITLWFKVTTEIRTVKVKIGHNER